MSSSNTISKKRAAPRKRVIGILMLITLSIGAAFVWWTIRTEQQRLKEEILTNVQIIGQGINRQRILNLSGSGADTSLPDYQRLKEQLTAMCTATQYRFLYLLGQRNDDVVFFFVDSEPSTSPDYSPPGQVYTEVSTSTLHIFSTKEAEVTPPETDRWGTWVSAFIPMIDSHSGKLIAVLGMDINANDWNKDILFHAAQSIVVTILLLVLLMTMYFYHQQTRKANRNFFTFFNSVNDFLFVVDTKYNILEINAAVTTCLGYSGDELRGTPFLHLFILEYPEKADTYIVEMIAQQSVSTLQLLTKDGRKMPVDLCVTEGEWNRMPAFFAVVKDISDQKKTSDALRENKNRLNNILNNMKDVVWSLSWPSCNILYLSPSIEKLYGRTAKEFIDNPYLWQEITHPDDKHITNKAFEQLQKEGTAERECRIIRPDGSIAWIHDKSKLIYDENNIPIRVDGLASDITERKLVEDAIFKSEERFKFLSNELETILDHIPGLVFYKDKKNNFIRVNKYFAQGHGKDKAELEGKNLTDLYTKENAEKYYQDDLSVINSGVAKINVEEKWETKESVKWVSTSKIPFVDITGEIVGVIGMSMDITERKRAEETSRLVKEYGEMGREVLQILNEPGNIKDSIQRTLAALKTRTGFDAVGIRLQDGDDFPYFVQEGFSKDFLMTENTLVERAADGGVCRDCNGNVRLECTCGLVISGKTDPANSYFTKGGSCWSNDKASTPFQDTRLHPRDRCLHDGYASVALVPIRNMDMIVGLIQFNDHRKGCFTLTIVELLEGIASHIGAALMRKRAEEALRESEGIFEQFMIFSPVHVYIKDDKLRLIKVSNSFENLLGKPISELLGKDSYELLPPEFAKSATADDLKTLKGGIVVQAEETLNGKVYSTIKFPIHREAGMPDYLAGFSVDITERKRAEDVLKQYEVILQTAIDGFWLVDMQGRLLEVNDAYCQMSGYNAQELLAMHILDLEAAETHDATASRIQKIIAQGEDRFESRHRHKDGRIFNVEINVKYRPVGDGQLVVFLQDITERKRMEELLREKEEHTRATLRSIGDGVIHTDAWGIITGINIVAESLVGWTNVEAYGRPIAEIFHIVNATTRRLEEIPIQRALTESRITSTNSNTVLIARDGTEHMISNSCAPIYATNGQIFGAVLVFHDVTEQKRTEEALIESKELIEKVVENIPHMIFLKEAKDLRFVMFNRAGEELLGYDRKALLGKNDLDLFPSEQAAHFMNDDREVLDGKAGMLDIPEEPLLTANKGTRLLHTRKVSIRGNDGKSKYLLGISEDITERKRMESTMISESKLSALGTLAAGVAHEINSPLQVITGVTESLIDQMSKDTVSKEYLLKKLELLKRNGWRCASITRGLLAYARPTIEQETECRLSDLGRESLLLIEHQLKVWANINVITQWTEEVPAVYCDRTKIVQVVLNLLINARDAMSMGGDIVLRTYYDESTKCPSLSVSDTGCGIPDSLIEKIFAPFFSTKPIGKGTGLGLSISLGIIKAHGGDITVTSIPEQGTTFVISLPAYHAEQYSNHASEHMEESMSNQTIQG